MADFLWKKVSLPALRAQLCTLAVAMSLNAWWRVPRDAFRFGGLAYGLALSVAALLVGTPAALLQLALGQLCQQGVVGMWRAVPFFTGVGYLRLLISYLSSVYTIIHLALITTNFFNTLNTSGTLGNCLEFIIPENLDEATVFNSSLLCFTEPLMARVVDEPGYYTAVSLLIASLWILMPFMLYNPVKFMKRIFYVSGPLVLVLGLVIVSCVGEWSDLLSIQKRSDWPNFLSPEIWHAALIQALCSVQVAGGFLVSAGDTLYSYTNVQWTTLTIVGANVVASWLGLVFWFAIGGSSEKDTSLLAIIYQVYSMAEEKQLDKTWPTLIFFTLGLSGIITMVILLYPVYERFRVVGGVRWRVLAAASSALGLAAALAVLAGRLPALLLLEGVALPLLVGLTTVIEISAFLFIYGWRIVIEDIEFLTGQALSKCWVLGWCVAPGVIAPVSAWWVAALLLQGADAWSAAPATLLAAAAAATLALLVCAAVAIARQVQYDFISKLKSSFTPSRRWGPRDPITHYYWVLRREEAERGTAPTSRGRLPRRPAPRSLPAAIHDARPQLPPRPDFERRNNSDDWFYTVFRRQFLKESVPELSNKFKRSKSLDRELDKTSLRTSTIRNDEKVFHIYSEIFNNNNNNNK